MRSAVSCLGQLSMLAGAVHMPNIVQVTFCTKGDQDDHPDKQREIIRDTGRVAGGSRDGSRRHCPRNRGMLAFADSPCPWIAAIFHLPDVRGQPFP